MIETRIVKIVMIGSLALFDLETCLAAKNCAASTNGATTGSIRIASIAMLAVLAATVGSAAGL